MQARKLLLAGIDPLAARVDERAKAAADALRAITFSECAKRYITDHRASWKNAVHAAQWNATLATYAAPIIGTLAAQAVDTAAVMQVLEQQVPDRDKTAKPLWQVKPETTHRLRGRIEKILDWATARGYRSGENPARWRGHIDKLLPSRSKIAKVRHHPALPYQQVSEFMAALRQRAGVGALALEFTILTAARTNEARRARRQEFDRAARLWIIPGARMKSGREHRVPLSDRAVEILDSLPSGGEFVFPGRDPAIALSITAMLQILKQMGRGNLTVHGFRSTFRDWGAEITAYPHEVLEMALAHVVDDKVEAAYRRGDLLERRRRLMADWAEFCQAPPIGAVIPIRAQR